MNRLAIYSLVAALLTLFSFCIGFAPFLPLTAAVCYPTAVVSGIVALVTGVRALHEIHASGKSGRWMALTGIWTGSLTILAVLCATALTLIALSAGADYIQTIWSTLMP